MRGNCVGQRTRASRQLEVPREGLGEAPKLISSFPSLSRCHWMNSWLPVAVWSAAIYNHSVGTTAFQPSFSSSTGILPPPALSHSFSVFPRTLPYSVVLRFHLPLSLFLECPVTLPFAGVAVYVKSTALQCGRPSWFTQALACDKDKRGREDNYCGGSSPGH